MAAICAIIPPSLVEAIATSTENPQHVKDAARRTLEIHKELFELRRESLQQDSMSGAQQNKASAIDLSAIPAVKATDSFSGSASARQPIKRIVYDSHHKASYGLLPGTEVRYEGGPAVEDKAVNEAYDNMGHVLDFYQDKFKWVSYDGQNAKVKSSVHFAKDFGNAYWDFGTSQMIFGDGNSFLYNFTASIDVIGHEFTHAVTGVLCPLLCKGQSGAINEHLSDVFGVMACQAFNNETANQTDWLIGEECLFPGTRGVALRSLKDPGNAYDDPRSGKDNQLSSMDQLKALTADQLKDISADAGGVHILSGIPNKAFYLVATALGGYSWEKAGQIWWQTLSSGHVPADCTIQQFADLTLHIAAGFGSESIEAVKNAWRSVGIVCTQQSCTAGAA